MSIVLGQFGEARVASSFDCGVAGRSGGVVPGGVSPPPRGKCPAIGINDQDRAGAMLVLPEMLKKTGLEGLSVEVGETIFFNLLAEFRATFAEKLGSVESAAMEGVARALADGKKYLEQFQAPYQIARERVLRALRHIAEGFPLASGPVPSDTVPPVDARLVRQIAQELPGCKRQTDAKAKITNDLWAIIGEQGGPSNDDLRALRYLQHFTRWALNEMAADKDGGPALAALSRQREPLSSSAASAVSPRTAVVIRPFYTWSRRTVDLGLPKRSIWVPAPCRQNPKRSIPKRVFPVAAGSCRAKKLQPCLWPASN
jgi:hypothetical protein